MHLPQYSLAPGDSEHRRLIALATHEEERVLDACRRAALRPGFTAVDLGCGPLGALAALHRATGPTGRVIGVDASATALERAWTLLAAESGITLVEADANEVSLGDLESPPVNLVYSRLMLLHQPSPARTLRNMRRLLSDDGVLIAHEPSDVAALGPASEPHVGAMTRVWELVIGAARARGASTDFGRRGRSYLEGAGFEIVSNSSYRVHYAPEIGFGIPQTALFSLRQAIEEHGLATAGELSDLRNELEEAKRDERVEWVSSPLMFEWIARPRPRVPADEPSSSESTAKPVSPGGGASC